MATPFPDHTDTSMHPSYTTWWAGWLLLGILLLVLGPESMWWFRAHLAGFLLLEGIGVRRQSSLGDTLSEFMQVLGRRAPSGTPWWRSWRMLVVGLAALISLEAGYVAAHPWGWLPVGLIVTTTVLLWNVYHWLRPEKYG